MKKIIISLAVLFAAASSASAQIGIVAGLTSSSCDIKSAVADVKNINQYHVGLAYRFSLGNIFAIQPAVLYNVKGTSIGAAVGDIASAKLDYKTGFIEIPVQAQIGVGIGNVVRVYGFGEPFVGYAVSNQVISDGSFNLAGLVTATSSDAKNTWDNIKNRLTYGVSLGAGVELFKMVQVSAKYFWDLGEVYNDDSSSNVSLDGVKDAVKMQKCSGIAATVGFFF